MLFSGKNIIVTGATGDLGTAITRPYLDDASLLTDQSKSTNHNTWQGQGNLIVMQP